jgi:hypothetical protein
MRVTDGGGYGGTIVVDIGGVRRASGLLADDGHAFQELGARVRGHGLPSMPGDVAGRVSAALAEVGSGLAGLPPTLIALAQELRVRAFWAEIADKLMAGYDLTGAQLTEFKAAYASGLLTRYAEPWEADLAKAYAKKVHDREHPGGITGFLHTVGDFFTGAWDAIKDPAVMIYHLTPFSGGDWTKHWADLGHGLAYGVTHPIAFANALVNLDGLQKRGFSYWLGNLVPAVATTLLSGGAAAGVRGAEGVAAVDRAAAGAADLERVGGLATNTAERAAELQAALPAASSGRVTIAVGKGTDASGTIRVVVGSSEKNGYLRREVKALLKSSGEEQARGPKGGPIYSGHAEDQILQYMKNNEITPHEIAAGRPICEKCEPQIAKAGARPTSPLKSAIQKSAGKR